MYKLRRYRQPVSSEIKIFCLLWNDACIDSHNMPDQEDPHYPGVCLEGLFQGLKNTVPSKSPYCWRWVVVRVFDPTTEAETGRSLCGWGQPGLKSETSMLPIPQRALIKHPCGECLPAFTSSFYYSIVLVILLRGNRLKARNHPLRDRTRADTVGVEHKSPNSQISFKEACSIVFINYGF